MHFGLQHGQTEVAKGLGVSTVQRVKLDGAARPA
jgi:hypothetical protein